MDLDEYYSELKEKSWLGQSVNVFNPDFDNIFEYIPGFRREPLKYGNHINKYLDLITRQPFRDDNKIIPVATVSPRYALIQHKEIIYWLRAGLEAAYLNIEDMQIEIILSEYGERFKIKVNIPDLNFDPGDGFKIEQLVEAKNSVDKSCALEFTIMRRRLVCLNGMWVADGQDRLRKIHNIDWMERPNISEFLIERISNVSGFEDLMSDLIDYDITIDEIENWADDVLSKKWGKHVAARFCQIARVGYDGRVGRAPKGSPPHEYFVSSDIEVPGACAPIKNLYHLSQALSWVANKRSSIEDSDSFLQNIPTLLKPLLESH
jgi:hypothetical protein